MTASEVINSSSTMDAALDPPRPVRNQSLQMVVERAQDQLRHLTLLHQEIAQRIAIIERTIEGLAFLYGGELQRKPKDGATAQRRRGITNACRVALNRTDAPLSTREVYAILQAESPDLFRQPGNHHAALLTILNRLVKYGEADTFLRNGNRFWHRHQPAGHRSVGVSGT